MIFKLMKTRGLFFLLASVAMIFCGPVVRGAVPDARQGAGIDETERFIFYSVLEGLYEDGLSNKDVDQILLKTDRGMYFHFICACPVCRATIWALQAYRGRPGELYGLKTKTTTFGPGLSAEMHDGLYSGKPRERLSTVNTLVKSWMNRRLQSLHLVAKDRAELLKALEAKRKEGMEALEAFRKHAHGPDMGVEVAAPAYVDLQECAVCNAFVDKPMKLPDGK